MSNSTARPTACVNCHVMRDVYDGWNHGSHKAVATCNDCHTPHDNVIAKYAVKALNGWNHSVAFTTGDFPEPIQINALNRDVAQQGCLYCHADMAVAAAFGSPELNSFSFGCCQTLLDSHRNKGSLRFGKVAVATACRVRQL